MAIYTHFGGMEPLRIEVCTEGFRRLAAHLGAVTPSDDPVADLIVLGVAYTTNARENPDLYRAMFLDRLPVEGLVDVGFGPPTTQSAADPTGDDDAMAQIATDLTTESLATFDVLVQVTARCAQTGRFSPTANPRVMAAQLWGLTHGLVTLELSGLIAPDHADALLGVTGRNLAIAFGDQPAAFDTSAASAMLRRTT